MGAMIRRDLNLPVRVWEVKGWNMAEKKPEGLLDLTCKKPFHMGKFTTISRRSSKAAGRFLGLSPRETEALKIMGTGATLKEIAAQMNVTERTVETFKRRIFSKLGVKSSVTAVALLAAFCAGAEMHKRPPADQDEDSPD